MEKGKIKVAIGMSGGVDSSVAAKILKDQGYDVVGFMLKLWSEDNTSCAAKDNTCCDIEGLEDAKRIANILDIPFYVIDARAKFKKDVADYFVNEYKKLRTPNPCVKCNELIKFGWLLDFAKKTGCDFLATGHYSKITKDGEGYHLSKGRDENKDQSYFLYKLNQEQFSHIMFPLGDVTKEETRALAQKWNLPVFEKRESQEICFIKDKDFRHFLRRNIPEKYFTTGDIVNSEGEVLGSHSGLINYTIGQRKGVDQDLKSKSDDDKEPLYVVGFDVKKNQLIVGSDSEIYKKEMVVSDVNWIDLNYESQVANIKHLKVKIRYRHPAVEISKIKYEVANKECKVLFEKPVRAITPGQSAVFYLGDEVLGGGTIT
jgi:tRNA-specific 2-thiouridylase